MNYRPDLWICARLLALGAFLGAVWGVVTYEEGRSCDD